MSIEPELASVEGVLRTLAWLVIGWFIYRTVSRLVSPIRGDRESSGTTTGRARGEIRIDERTPPRTGKVDDSAEFVDFEEVDEPNNDT